jgi:hypothetical protein
LNKVETWIARLEKIWKAIRQNRQVGKFLSPSIEVFSDLRKLQRTRRRSYSDIAARLPRYRKGTLAFQHASLLAELSWVPANPIQIATPKDDLADDDQTFITTFGEKSEKSFLSGDHQEPEVSSRIRKLLPSLSGMGPVSLSKAILQIERPDEERFQSRPCYSLTNVSSDSQTRVSLSFRKAYYFDYIDCGELLALELIREFYFFGDSDKGEMFKAVARNATTCRLDSTLDKKLKLRSLLGDWRLLARRPSVAGVNVLTVFVDEKSNSATFPMMSRASTVGSAGGAFHVIPAGEFQPTSDASTDWEKHCTLWQTILRETAEEILLVPEAETHSKQMEELAKIEPIASMLSLVRANEWKAYYLGIGVDALTLKPEILVVSIINQQRFSVAFKKYLPDGKLPKKDSEGDVHRTGGGWGSLLTANNLRTYRDDPAALPAASGCIELFLRSARSLLGRELPP